MNPKIIVICGPTGVGKTDLAVQLASKVNGVIVACDSRQVYRGMDIGTGKDTSNLGIDLVEPNQPFSVMNYISLIQPLISRLIKLNKTPIITAGTGLYLKSLFNPPSTGSIKPNPNLRLALDQLPVSALQAKLMTVNPARYHAMNHSDQNNPRRLIRAIEIAQSSKTSIKRSSAQALKRLTIGLTAPLKIIDERINARVLSRATPTFSQEVRKLAALYPDFASFPAATATGYHEWLYYLAGKISKAQALALWQLHERQYARRQLTWFKKIPQIKWLDTSRSKWQIQVEPMLQS